MRSGEWRFGKALALTGITALLASSCGGRTSADVASNATDTPSSVPPSNAAPPSTTGAAPDQALTTVRSNIVSPAFAYSYLYGQSPNPSATDSFDLTWTAYLTDLGKIVQNAKSIAGAVSSIIGGFNAAVGLLQFLGLLPAPVDEVLQLTDDVNAIETGATWEALHDYVDPLLSDVQTVAQIDVPEQGVSNVITSGEDGDAASDVQKLFAYSAWHRVAGETGNDSSTDKAIPHPYPPTNGSTSSWTTGSKVIAPAPIDAMNEVFRVAAGAPAVLSAIALRLTILGEINQSFYDQIPPAYRPELQSMHDKLAQMNQTMLGGIQCGWQDYGYGPGLSGPGKLEMSLRNVKINLAPTFTPASRRSLLIQSPREEMARITAATVPARRTSTPRTSQMRSTRPITMCARRCRCSRCNRWSTFSRRCCAERPI